MTSIKRQALSFLKPNIKKALSIKRQVLSFLMPGIKRALLYN